MKITRWKALFYYHVLFLLFFACYCISCREERSAKESQSKLANESTPIDTSFVLAHADSLFLAGEQCIKRNQNDSALSFHQKALTLRISTAKETAAVAESYFKVGWLYLQDFKYDVADPYLEQARLVADKNQSIDPRLYIEIYLRNAECKVNLKDIASSLSFANKALDLVEKYLPNDKLMFIRVYRSLFVSHYYRQDYVRAIESLNLSLSFADASDYRRLGSLYSSFGSAYQAAGDHEKALFYFNKSIAENLKWTDLNSDELAKVYLQKAFALEEIGLVDSARYFLVKNMEIRRSVYGEKNVNTYGAFLSLAQMDFDNGQYDSASRNYQKSLIALIRQFNSTDISSNPKPEETELNSDLITGLAGKAKALRMMSLANSNSALKELSLRTYLLADSIFSIFRNISSYDDPILEQLETGYVNYAEMTELAFDLFNSSGNLKYANIALAIMERSRSVLVQNSLQKAEAYSLAGVETTLKKKELELNGRRAELVRSLSSSEISEKVSDSLNNALLLLGGESFRFREELKRKNPTYYASKYQAPAAELKDLQFFLKGQNATLLEYLWSDSAIYLLKITPTEIKTSVIRQSPKFRNAFRDFTSEMKVGEESTTKMDRFVRFCNSAHLLYDNLIRNSLERLPPNSHLIISADGPLSVFPFEALIKNKPDYNEVSYHLSYLVLDHPVSYTYSSTLLLKQPENSRHGKKLLALGFAGNGSSREKRNGLVNLPGTRREVEAIKEVMKNNTNKYFLENDASESLFKNSINGFNIVHLALHGVSDTLNALESRIIFRSETDTVDDGQLYAHELYDLDLNQLDLAVLSACESGIGKQQAGEGVMSMARGFAYAGCPSLVMSLWKLDDQTSAKVMSSFYKYLAAKENIDVSLAEAKRNYLSQASEFKSHPSYWAAFIPVGSMQPLASEHFRWMLWLMALFVLIICSAFVIIRHNRKT